MSIRGERAPLVGVTAAIVLVAGSVGLARSCLWTRAGSAPQDVEYSPTVYDSGLQRTLAVSGWYTAPAQIWSWDGAVWSLIDSSGPSRREGAPIAYDSVRDRLVMFGGYDGYTSLGDTWEWDRTTWRRVATTGPSPRYAATMVFDSARGRTVLFGGAFYPGGVFYGDTWEWDGQAWANVATTGPSARIAYMAFDSNRDRTVLYGGGAPNNSYTDLWEWDGVSWLQRPTNSPGPGMSWMVFDSARSRVVACFYPGTLPITTWELDPATAVWTIRDPGHAPLGIAAFDSARSRVVSVGWLQSGAPVTFEYDGSGTDFAPCLTQQPRGGTYTAGSPLVLSAAASGSGALTYQWLRNGAPMVDGGRVSGATTPTLTISPAAIDDSGSYGVLVTDHCGTEWSESASVEVVPV